MNLFHADTFGKRPRSKRVRKRPNYRRYEPQEPCSTKGCKGTAVSRGRCMRCYQYLYQHGARGEQIDNADLEWVITCCWKACRNPPDPETADGEFPSCTYHLNCVRTMMMLEDIGYKDVIRTMPADNDYLFARFIAELREYTLSKGEDATIFRNAVGETPLYQIFIDCYAFYLPLLRSL